MWDNLPLLSLILLSPLLGVLVLTVIPKENGRLLQRVGIAASFLPLLFSCILFVQFQAQIADFQFVEQHSWIRIPLDKSLLGATSFTLSFDYHLAVDGLSLPLVFLTALVAAMAALASVQIKKRWKLFYILFLLLETAMFGVFMARDLFLFFLFFEAALVPVFFLVGIWGSVNREKAAIQFLLYNGIGSALMLTAFLILIATAGFTLDEQTMAFQYSGDIQTIMNNLFHNPEAYLNYANNPFTLTAGMKTFLFFLLLLAFGIKLPVFPFHTWMLKMHQEAPPSVVMIHSGILLKMGAYGLIRFGILLFPEQAKSYTLLLAVLGLINLLYGAILAFVQKDFRLVLAYSSVSQMGIVLLGLAAFNTAGWSGAVFQLVSHGLISALLFLLVGSLCERTGTTELAKLSGLASSIPFISGILLFAGLASLGLPGLSGFVGELLVFVGLSGSYKAIAAVGLLGLVLAAAYMLRAVLAMTFGPPGDEAPRTVGGSGVIAPNGGGAASASGGPRYRDARLIEAVPMIILTTFILLLGVYPGMISHTVEKAVADFTSHIESTVAKAGE
ncbi:complex I subunit 4 family protein [Gorillibacterium timonense]|uniref:complex I subunit 4 family protein n=1 Tax=Gorillibacterium timonense TaxID=1689269 RepID=UPI00071D3749|nr:NADH-quinone oxidoreductase subunit M [Gorillibacterium timonense]